MNGKNFFPFGFFVGMIVGFGAAYFLSTKEGKKTLRKFKKQIKPYLEEITNLLENNITQINAFNDKNS